MDPSQLKLNNRERDRMCFACGEDNPISLGLDFQFIDNNQVTASFIPVEEHQGYDGIMHGGLISTLLDEAMSKVIYMKGIKAVTAELTVRFKKKVEIGNRLKVLGMITKRHGKLIFTRAFLEDDDSKDNDDNLYARAEGKFIRVD